MADRRNIRLVKNQRETKKKIESPLAKYNSVGQLFCVLCDIPVKSAILWNSHVLGKKHKENLVSLKVKTNNKEVKTINKDQSVTEVQQLNTRHADDSTFASPTLKRTSQNMAETNTDTPEKKIKVDSKSNMNKDDSTEGIPEGFFDDPKLDSNSNMKKDDSTKGIPEGFFDDPKIDSNSNMNKDDSTEGIPEGFFDDPKIDAKVRKVEYKDPAEEEWEKFQKAMQVEAQVSQSIVEGEDEESRVDREFSELSEQRLYFLRADTLRDKQSSIKVKLAQQEAVQRQSQVEISSNSDDSDFEEFFDWRAKKVL